MQRACKPDAESQPSVPQAFLPVADRRPAPGKGELPEREIARSYGLTKPRYVQYPVHMNAVTYTEARESLATMIRRVCQDHDPIIITRKRENSVVMLALDDYESLVETAYLLRSPRNARRLLDSIKELDENKGAERVLAE